MPKNFLKKYNKNYSCFPKYNMAHNRKITPYMYKYITFTGFI